jgi:hypothetical protein
MSRLELPYLEGPSYQAETEIRLGGARASGRAWHATATLFRDSSAKHHPIGH